MLELDLAKAPLEPILAGADGVFHLAGQPGVRASWGETLRALPASGTSSPRSGSSRPRRPRTSASSSRRPRPSTATPSATRRRRTWRRSRSRPTGSRSSRASSSRTRSAAGSGLDAVLLRYFTVYGPRQRPDMAFTAMLEALARGDSVPALRRRQRGEELHVRRRRGRRDGRGDGARPRRRGLQRRRRRRGDDERGDRARRGDRRTAASTSSGRAAATGDVRRTKADVAKAEADLGWSPQTGARRGHAGAVALGGGRVARVNRPEPVPDPDAEREVDLRSVWERIAARWWLPVLGIVLGAVDRLRARARRRQGLRGGDARRDGPAVLAERRRAGAELPHERARRLRDRPLGGGARRLPHAHRACAFARSAGTSAPRSSEPPAPAPGRRARRS